MDYDLTDIPATYNRGHDHGTAVLDQWMKVVDSRVDARGIHRILDLACGTGRFAPSLAEQFQATVIGVDPSGLMLQQARNLKARSGRVVLVFGYGEALPIRDESIDMVFISMVFHHFRNPVDVAGECERVLRPGGRVCLRAISADQIPNYPYVPFFPSSARVLRERLPSVHETRAAFEAAFFRTLSAEIVIQQIAPDFAAYAEKLASRTDSVLNSLDLREFENGLRALRERHADVGIAPVTEPIDFMVFGKEDKGQ